jgi:ketosteroid isomerase-like protein
MGAGRNPEAEVRASLQEWRAALLAQDLDTLMTSYSDNFSSNQGGTKEELRRFLQGAIDAGYLDGADVSLENTVVTVEGDRAVAAPVGLTSAAGGMALRLELVREGGQWLIVYSTEA